MPKAPYLEIGQAVSTHGVRGEIRVQPWCDSPAQWVSLRFVYTGANGEGKRRAAARIHGEMILLKLEDVDTVEQAAALRGTVFFAARDDLALPEGRYFIRDLLGLQVCDAQTGEAYGTVTEVSHTGANDVYHMQYQGREVLIPAIPSVVRDIDPDGGVLRITPIAGLLDDED